MASIIGEAAVKAASPKRTVLLRKATIAQQRDISRVGYSMFQSLLVVTFAPVALAEVRIYSTKLKHQKERNLVDPSRSICSHRHPEEDFILFPSESIAD